eukprot:1201156-Rhodomonas_salina.2
MCQYHASTNVGSQILHWLPAVLVLDASSRHWADRLGMILCMGYTTARTDMRYATTSRRERDVIELLLVYDHCSLSCYGFARRCPIMGATNIVFKLITDLFVDPEPSRYQPTRVLRNVRVWCYQNLDESYHGPRLSAYARARRCPVLRKRMVLPGLVGHGTSVPRHPVPQVPYG